MESHLVHLNRLDVLQQFYFGNPNNGACIGWWYCDRFLGPYDRSQFLVGTYEFDDRKYYFYIRVYYIQCSQRFCQYRDRHFLNSPLVEVTWKCVGWSWDLPFLPTQFRLRVLVPVPQTAEHCPHSVHVVHSPSWFIRFGDAVSAKHWALKQKPTPPPCMLHFVPSNGAECFDLQNVGFTLSEHQMSLI